MRAVGGAWCRCRAGRTRCTAGRTGEGVPKSKGLLRTGEKEDGELFIGECGTPRIVDQQGRARGVVAAATLHRQSDQFVKSPEAQTSCFVRQQRQRCGLLQDLGEGRHGLSVAADSVSNREILAEGGGEKTEKLKR